MCCSLGGTPVRYYNYGLADREALRRDPNLIDGSTPLARADIERWTANIVADQARRRAKKRSSRTVSGRSRLADNHAVSA
jgi:hypothetical protein